MDVYWIIVGLVIGLGMIMPQHGYYRKFYIITMAVLHAFVCGFRYMYLTGDLMKYSTEYSVVGSYGWFSDEVFHEGRNAGFYWLMKLISLITHGDFQSLLLLIAVITEVIVAILIYRYSPMPWFSYLVWNCMGFYVAGFSLIKQYLAMSIIMCAMMCIFEKNLKGFLIFTLIAGFIHMPALIFLPAYFIAERKVTMRTILGYIVFAGIIFLFRNQIVNQLTEFYYDEETFQRVTTGLGGRFTVILLILLCGFCIKGFKEKPFEKLFNIIVVAAVLQMFSNFDNVFSRLADYYLQFTVLFIPMIFYTADRAVQLNKNAAAPLLPFNQRSLRLLVLILTVVLIWWYNTTCIGVTIEYSVDDYTNFRFMWEVID